MFSDYIEGKQEVDDLLNIWNDTTLDDIRQLVKYLRGPGKDRVDNLMIYFYPIVNHRRIIETDGTMMPFDLISFFICAGMSAQKFQNIATQLELIPDTPSAKQGLLQTWNIFVEPPDITVNLYKMSTMVDKSADRIFYTKNAMKDVEIIELDNEEEVAQIETEILEMDDDAFDDIW
jgi:predicted HAD superfamily phosphohydrolase